MTTVEVMAVPESTTTRDAVAIKTVMAVIKAVVDTRTATAATRTTVEATKTVMAATKTVVVIRTVMEDAEARTTMVAIVVALDQTTEAACNPTASRTTNQA